MKKVLGVVVMVACAAVVAWAADGTTGSSAASDTATMAKTDSVKTFTAEELAKFDGKEGRLAYVAVEGVVYDVTKAKGWKNGEHKGFKAGRDITADIKKQSPHGVAPVKKNPVVGKYVIAPASSAPAGS